MLKIIIVAITGIIVGVAITLIWIMGGIQR